MDLNHRWVERRLALSHCADGIGVRIQSSAMAIRTPHNNVPQWQSTLGPMKAAGTHVICSCSACGAYHVVDVDEMISRLGADGSLWDRRPPCEVGDCDALCKFLASPSPSTPMRLLASWWAFTLEDLPPEAWMGGWLGLAYPPGKGHSR